MKMVMDRIDIVVKLKEKIAVARANNDSIALQLEKLLEGIMKESRTTSAV